MALEVVGLFQRRFQKVGPGAHFGKDHEIVERTLHKAP
jgi:hypothetical protein